MRLLALALLLCACSNASAPEDAQGNVGAFAFVSSVTIATTDPHQTILIFSDNAVSCDDLTAGGVQGRAADALYVLLSDQVGGQWYPASFAKSYNVGDSAAGAQAWFMRWSSTCDVAEQTPANAGSVEVTMNGGGHLAGNFTFGFPVGGVLYGHFDVDLCPAIASGNPPLCL